MKRWIKTCILVLLLALGISAVPVMAQTTITLNKSKVTLYKGQSVTLIATTQNAGSKVKWTSSKKSVATVNQAGKVTAKKVGKTTITAKVNGVKTTCVVTVKKPTITLNMKKMTLYAGDGDFLVPTVKGKSQKVKWKSSKPSVATVDSNGLVSAKKAGKAVISVTTNGVTAKCTVTVKKSYTKAQAEKALKKYIRKNETTNFWYFYEEMTGREHTFWVTFTGPGMKMKYFVDFRTGNIYESGVYFGVYEWKSTDEKRLVGNLRKYL